MSARSRTLLWQFAAGQLFAWWIVAGFFAFGLIPPANDAETTYMVFSAIFGIGGSVAAATFPGYPS